MIVEVVRSGFVESRHRVRFATLRPDGSTAATDDRPILPRSSNKPLQAVAMLELGWTPTEPQLAIGLASHSGEPRHLDLVRTLLDDAGLADSTLQCPVDPPLGEQAAEDLRRAGEMPSRVTMNCSGKHAAMLATCAVNGWDLDSYLAPDHPLQQAITATIERLAGERVTHVAIDGCGAPQHALTLAGLARAYQRLVTAPRDSAEHRVVTAATAHPELVAGTGRAATELMQAVPGLLAKDGAEGVFAAASAGQGAVAVKVEDGAQRAAPVAVVTALRAIGVPDNEALERLARPEVRGGGRVVGELRAVSQP